MTSRERFKQILQHIDALIELVRPLDVTRTKRALHIMRDNCETLMKEDYRVKGDDPPDDGQEPGNVVVQ